MAAFWLNGSFWSSLIWAHWWPANFIRSDGVAVGLAFLIASLFSNENMKYAEKAFFGGLEPWTLRAGLFDVSSRFRLSSCFRAWLALGDFFWPLAEILAGDFELAGLFDLPLAGLFELFLVGDLEFPLDFGVCLTGDLEFPLDFGDCLAGDFELPLAGDLEPDLLASS